MSTYRNIRSEVNAAIVGTQRLLDIGNGGVFDYDTQLVPEIVGVDLFLDEVTSGIPENVTLRRGDALALDEADAAYDGVLIVFVFHHLVSTDVEGTIREHPPCNWRSTARARPRRKVDDRRVMRIRPGFRR